MGEEVIYKVIIKKYQSLIEVYSVKIKLCSYFYNFLFFQIDEWQHQVPIFSVDPTNPIDTIVRATTDNEPDAGAAGGAGGGGPGGAV